MKKTIILMLMMVATTFGVHAQKPDEPGKILRHVVLFKFKNESGAADIKKVEDAFRALPAKIREIKGFEWGRNNSPENHSQGFTHAFLVSFRSEKDRDVYLPHPAHKDFVNILSPHLDKVLVIDYWAQE